MHSFNNYWPHIMMLIMGSMKLVPDPVCYAQKALAPFLLHSAACGMVYSSNSMCRMVIPLLYSKKKV